MVSLLPLIVGCLKRQLRNTVVGSTLVNLAKTLVNPEDEDKTPKRCKKYDVRNKKFFPKKTTKNIINSIGLNKIFFIIGIKRQKE